MRKILLVDVDSKIPNLALMKISAYHKSIGDTVGFDVRDPKYVYASVIFSKSKNKIVPLLRKYPNADFNIGGVGWSLEDTLTDHIELMKPDYSLYPGIDHSIGFTTRGCVRNCYFCVVPKKEGTIRFAQHPEEFHDPRFNKIRLLDNNVLAYKKGEWFFELTDWINDHGLSVDFMSGLDIRLLTTDIAKRMKETKIFKPWKFAFDNTADTDAVLSGIEKLKEAGINTRNCLFYVYVHDEKDVPIKSAHCDLLKLHGATAYVMVNRNVPLTHDLKLIARYTRPHLFWTRKKDDLGNKTREYISFYEYAGLQKSLEDLGVF